LLDHGIELIRFGRLVGPLERELEQMERWDPDRIHDWQVSRLRAILDHCTRRVPYYRDLFRRIGFDPERVNSALDLQVLPALTKDIIRRHASDLFAEGISPSGIKAGKTGGSTGEPTPYYFSREESAYIHATFRRCFAWVGARWGDRLLKIGAASTASSHSLRTSFVKWISESVQNIFSLPVPSFDETSMDECLRTVERIEPAILYAYPAALEMIARRMVQTGFRLPSVRVLWTSSETLFPHQRETIRQAFGLEVFDGYGTGDAPIAMECSAHQGLHVFQHAKLIEVVDGDGREVRPGQMGRVLITQLHNFAWPCIRYDTGDIAERMAEDRECACGVRLPRFRRILGRIGDTLVTPDGRVIPAGAIPYFNVFGVIANKVRCYQIYQDQKDHVVMRIVRADGYDQAAEDHMRGEMSSILGSSVRIDFEYVDDIPLTRSRKRRLVVSALPASDLPFDLGASTENLEES